jgi:hypothetical protein
LRLIKNSSGIACPRRRFGWIEELILEGEMGIVLGEIAAFIAALCLIVLVFKWGLFKLRVAMREDKIKYFERHGLDVNEENLKQ